VVVVVQDIQVELHQVVLVVVEQVLVQMVLQEQMVLGVEEVLQKETVQMLGALVEME
jgi:hypothetical protein